MASKEQRRQKKLAKKRTKQVLEKKSQARQKNALQSLAGQMKDAATGKIEHCAIGEAIYDSQHKFGTVTLARRMSNGRIARADFLVDGMCLGVKGASGLICFPTQYREILESRTDAPPQRPADPGNARALVEAAIIFAAKFGLPCCATYQDVQHIWGDIEPQPATIPITFGNEDGKPVFIPGPQDTLPLIKRTLDKLRNSVGEGNYIYDQTMWLPANESINAYDDPELDVDIDEDLVSEGLEDLR